MPCSSNMYYSCGVHRLLTPNNKAVHGVFSTCWSASKSSSVLVIATIPYRVVYRSTPTPVCSLPPEPNSGSLHGNPYSSLIPTVVFHHVATKFSSWLLVADFPKPMLTFCVVFPIRLYLIFLHELSQFRLPKFHPMRHNNVHFFLASITNTKRNNSPSMVLVALQIHVHLSHGIHCRW